MKTSIKMRAALRLAKWIDRRADEIQFDLEGHVRDEEMRIILANKRVRGLRLYAAWSGVRRSRIGGPRRIFQPLPGCSG